MEALAWPALPGWLFYSRRCRRGSSHLPSHQKEKKKKFAEAELLEILEEGAGRRQPPCPVASQCGGCQWQHLEYESQKGWKERLFVKL